MKAQLDVLENRIDRVELKVDKIEQKLAELEINELIVKGREIERIYSSLRTIGVLDIYKIHDELLNLKQTITKIEYHPWEWLQRDPVAMKAFLSKIHKMIADEIRQASLFTLYQENPQVVVRIVKDAVKEYLDIWEVNNQIAKQLVDQVLKDGYIKELVNHITTLILSPQFKEEFLRMLVVKKQELYEAKQLLEKEG